MWVKKLHGFLFAHHNRQQFENVLFLTGSVDEQEKNVGNLCHIML